MTALSRGWKRQQELAVESATARQAVADGLVRDLGRQPGAGESLLIESIASQVVEARKLRRQGRSSEMQDRLIYRGIARLGIKEGPAKPAGPSLADIRARYDQPPATLNVDQAPEAPADEARTGEAPNGPEAAP
jgi:hypothetical protein